MSAGEAGPRAGQTPQTGYEHRLTTEWGLRTVMNRAEQKPVGRRQSLAG